jgi:glutathione S-transferase
MIPHLVSSKTCPFVQRAIILLLEKHVEHEVTYVDLGNKPEWFLEKSPRGKVPLLIVDGVVLFESQAICEFLDETGGGERLTPADPVQRARDRAFFPFAGEDLFIPLFRAMVADTESGLAERDQLLRERLARLEQELPGDWLSASGARFGLADVAVAPVFTRLDVLARRSGRSWLDDGSALAAYSARLLSRPSLPGSVPADFEQRLVDFLTSRSSFLLRERT